MSIAVIVVNALDTVIYLFIHSVDRRYNHKHDLETLACNCILTLSISPAT